MTPRTPAYREIWLDGERIAGGEEEVVEPIYGKTYLPRKFKVVVAVPPSNDVDVFAHDLGYIAILDDAGNVAGWNVTVGGGMGMTHGEEDTYPRTADVMGFCATGDAVKVAEAVVTVQRDWGDRKNRKHAPVKYTIEDRGLDAFRAEVERRGRRQARPRQSRSRLRRLATNTAVVAGRQWLRASDVCLVQNGRVHDLAGACDSKPRRCGRLQRCTTAISAYAQPEPDHRQRADFSDGLRSSAWYVGGRSRALVRLAAKFHGLCRLANLRAGACRKRTLFARSDDRARRKTGGARALCG